MDRIFIQCVVVLYKQRPDQARSLATLLEICREYPPFAEHLGIFVQDNSPEAAPIVSVQGPIRIEYHHSPDNPGLAAAYNRGLEVAKNVGAEWLLLLDQDTVLDPHFCIKLLAAVQSDIAGQACAIVPELVKGNRVLSPHFVRRFTYEPCPPGFSGFAAVPLMPCNSAACLKIEALNEVGGFPEEYWLDFLDFIVFHRLQDAGGRIYVLDCQVEHNLSLINLEAEVSEARYSNLLAAEWRFIKETGARGGTLIHRIRLLKRSIVDAIKLSNKRYASQALRAVLK